MAENKEWKETEIGKIPIDWDILPINKLLAVKRNAMAMGPFGSNITKNNFVNEGVPIIRGNNLKPLKFLEEGFVYVTEEKSQKLKASLVERKDLVITHRGTLGQVCIIPENSKFDKYIISQSGLKISFNEELINPYFAYYFLNSRLGQHLLLRNRSQVGVPAIAQPTTSIKKIPIPIPYLQEQEKIVSILKSLDDKIELNNQMNQTLEEMAQAIFKEWFVEFNFLNEDGVPYKDNGGEMEESELGMIPKGWKVSNFGEVSSCYDSKRVPLSKNKRAERQGEFPYYGATSIMDYVDDYIFEGIYLMLGEDGSVIKEDGTPFVQYVWGKIWVNNHAHVLQGKNGISTEHLLVFSKQMDLNPYITGAVQLKLNQRNMNSIPFIRANSDIENRFNKVIQPLFSKIRAIYDENQTLIKTRDTLLPKLMSGEVRV